MAEYEKPDETEPDVMYTSTGVGGNLVPDELSDDARRVADGLRERLYLPRYAGPPPDRPGSSPIDFSDDKVWEDLDRRRDEVEKEIKRQRERTQEK